MAMKKYEIESCQEEFSVMVENGKSRTFIRDFVTLSRLCFKPSSWWTIFTISRIADQIKKKLCNSCAFFCVFFPCRPIVMVYVFFVFEHLFVPGNKKLYKDHAIIEISSIVA